jgi:multidrug efflux pump subunit AcrA (membrane-fusion protein)
LAQKISANGNLAAWQEAIVGAEAHGLKITEVRVNVGDRVQRGDVLAVLQGDSLQAEFAQAQGTLAEATASAQEAKAQADRARSLQQQGFFSAAQLSQARRRVCSPPAPWCSCKTCACRKPRCVRPMRV